MTAATLTLTDFLLARIEEDEADARRLAERTEGHGLWSAGRDMGGPREDDEYATLYIGAGRVLAECEAKRRVVERCRPRYFVAYRESERLLCEAFDQEYMKTVAHSEAIWPAGGEETLRDLAAVYSDHPDYRDEWRPAP